MFCRKCGSKIPTDSLFCSCCGEAVKEIQNDKTTELKSNDKKKNLNSTWILVVIGSLVAIALDLVVYYAITNGFCNYIYVLGIFALNYLASYYIVFCKIDGKGLIATIINSPMFICLAYSYFMEDFGVAPLIVCLDLMILLECAAIEKYYIRRAVPKDK